MTCARYRWARALFVSRCIRSCLDSLSICVIREEPYSTPLLRSDPLEATTGGGGTGVRILVILLTTWEWLHAHPPLNSCGFALGAVVSGDLRGPISAVLRDSIIRLVACRSCGLRAPRCTLQLFRCPAPVLWIPFFRVVFLAAREN